MEILSEMTFHVLDDMPAPEPKEAFEIRIRTFVAL